MRANLYSILSPFSFPYFMWFPFSKAENTAMPRLMSGFSVGFRRQIPNYYLFFFPQRKLYGISHCIKSNTEHIKSFAFLSSHQLLYCIVSALAQFLASRKLWDMKSRSYLIQQIYDIVAIFIDKHIMCYPCLLAI